MDKPLTLVGHLSELRRRIIVCLITLGVATVFCVPSAPNLLKVLKFPIQGIIGRLVFFGPEEAFLIYLRIAFFSALIFTMPVILYELWMFVSPAIEEHLKKYINHFIVTCFLLFIGGCFFAYFILIPPSLKFLLSFGRGELEPVISAQRYISFILALTLGCGLVFQMPILSFIFTKIGVINYRILRKKYKYALVIIFIIAAIITPTPDAFNMLVLSLPMLFLYEMSIWVSWLAHKNIAPLG